ncbi:ArsR/SmtB family transcription factor [Sphingomonas sp. PR090111-T3T-6A]|uniref:ArsR/SmtB family transcription factor n=1 Tax=Sphingomonas sp. PR090111-T3T-6A TaxID=685778 RepID=UPI0003816682|nr:metalloregulator ArsR/SmtB family transcription factor [Sphingomonas sp. PR090111-T3T-6A]
MNSESAVAALGALAQTTRLATMELLVRSEPAGLSAGDIARRLGVTQNTLSGHLSILRRGGMVLAQRNSRSIIYRANVGEVLALLSYLGSLGPPILKT